MTVNGNLKENWFEIKKPFKTVAEYERREDGACRAVVSATDIYDPLGVLPEDIYDHSVSGVSKIHPDETNEYDQKFAMQLARNRGEKKYYEYIANGVNERLEYLDDYLKIIHNRMTRLDQIHTDLMLRSMNLTEVL